MIFDLFQHCKRSKIVILDYISSDPSLVCGGCRRLFFTESQRSLKVLSVIYLIEVAKYLELCNPSFKLSWITFLVMHLWFVAAAAVSFLQCRNDHLFAKISRLSLRELPNLVDGKVLTVIYLIEVAKYLDICNPSFRLSLTVKKLPG